jgi:hypothetical protein
MVYSLSKKNYFIPATTRGESASIQVLLLSFIDLVKPNIVRVLNPRVGPGAAPPWAAGERPRCLGLSAAGVLGVYETVGVVFQPRREKFSSPAVADVAGGRRTLSVAAAWFNSAAQGIDVGGGNCEVKLARAREAATCSARRVLAGKLA